MTDFWNFVVLTLDSGVDLTVGRLVLTGLAGVFGLGFSFYFSKLIGRRLIRSSRISADASQVIQRLAFYLFIMMVVIGVLSLLHIPVTAFAFLSGAVAIGFGFAAQNVISNLISGWLLMTARPVRIGDFIELGDVTGTIERIENRSTLIRRVDGAHVLVPNSQMLENTLTNWTLVDRDIRTKLTVGVAYGSDVNRVREVLEEAANAHPLTKEVPPPVAVFEDFGDSALVFELFFWVQVSGERELRLVRSDLRFEIVRRFEQEGIVIAFPQLDAHLDSSRPIQVQLQSSDGKNKRSGDKQ
ncbi:MAG: mechanosensitive ion channel protein [Lysobacteraceae bacterium]|nr:MAG: mechanosensitive ion channel protein [Xanthomonadaceae bacterium]